MNNFFLYFLLLLFCSYTCKSQVIFNSNEGLKITALSNTTYFHQYENSNGIIYHVNNEAIIVSTPPSDAATKELINWVRDSLDATIIAYVIDRWHPDAMEGLDIIKELSIKNYAYIETKELAIKKGLPIPENTFSKKKTIKIGSKRIICHFLGEAHTTDGIVVWLPNEKILFAGNEIRNYNGWIGNIGDANLSTWSKTAQRIKSRYRKVNIVIPGHGKYGGPELIDYTIKLYDFAKDRKNTYNLDKNSLFIKDSIGVFHIQSYSKYKNDSKSNVIYKKGILEFKMKDKEVSIFFDSATYDYNSKQIKILSGFIKIEDNLKVESFYFNQAYIKSWDTPIEITLIIKEIKT